MTTDEQWGKYWIRGRIAAGGMAEVFKADQVGPAGFVKPVCLKRILPGFSDNAQFVQMFESEARIVSQLQHANIVAIHDFDRHQGQLFLAMELIDGPNLKQILKGIKRLGLQPPPGFAVRVMQGLFAALEHAHTRTRQGKVTPVIHRDVSPHNILVSREGDVKLTDFGIAKSEGISNATSGAVLKGKLAYLSPEQATGKPVTPLSDLFCAGLVFFETLTTRRLFGDVEKSLIGGIPSYRFEPVPWLSDSLNALLGSLLTADPKERMASATDALTALANTGIAPLSPAETRGFLTQVIPLISPDDESVPNRVSAPAASAAVEKPLENRQFGRTAPQSPPPGNALSPEVAPPSVAAALPPAVAPPPAAPTKTASRLRITVIVTSAALLIGLIYEVATKGSLAESDTAVLKVSGSSIEVPTTRPADLSAGGAIEKATTPRVGNGETRPPVEKAVNPVVKLDPVSEPPEAGAAPTRLQPSKPGRHRGKSPPTKSASTPSEPDGYVNINVRPWATVSIDGVDKGATPLKRIPAAAGRHIVVLENRELGFREVIHVKVLPNRTISINRAARSDLIRE